MSQSMMHNLYYGTLVPWERKCSRNPDYGPLNEKISRIKGYFKELLPPDEYQKFEEWERLEADVKSIDEIDVFEYGFSMGTLIMMDVFGFKERQLSELESG